jgi:hypothetical protein
VCREVPARVEVLHPETMVVLNGERVEVLELQTVLGVPRLGPPQLVTGAFRLQPPFAGLAGPAGRFLGHVVIVPVVTA